MKLKLWLDIEDRSYAWLARKLNITQQHLYDMMSGRRKLQSKYIEGIYKICGQKVSREEIMEEFQGEEDESRDY